MVVPLLFLLLAVFFSLPRGDLMKGEDIVSIFSRLARILTFAGTAIHESSQIPEIARHSVLKLDRGSNPSSIPSSLL